MQCAQDNQTGNKCGLVEFGLHDPSRTHEDGYAKPNKNVKFIQKPVEYFGWDERSNIVYWQDFPSLLDQESAPGQCFSLGQTGQLFHVFTSFEYISCPCFFSIFIKSSSVNIAYYESSDNW